MSDVLGKPKKSMMTTGGTMNVQADGFIKTQSHMAAVSANEDAQIIREINEDEEGKTTVEVE